jgi:hypothetical protein
MLSPSSPTCCSLRVTWSWCRCCHRAFVYLSLIIFALPRRNHDGFVFQLVSPLSPPLREIGGHDGRERKKESSRYNPRPPLDGACPYSHLRLVAISLNLSVTFISRHDATMSTTAVIMRRGSPLLSMLS